MIERRNVIVIAMLLLMVGCRQDSPEAVRQKQQGAAARGREKFEEELVQKKLTWYVYGGQSAGGFNQQTGLPEQVVSTMNSQGSDLTPDYVRAHNDAILQYMSQNGTVPGSFKPWEPQLYNPSVYFNLHASDVQQLKSTGQPVKSPDGQYTLIVQSVNGKISVSIITPEGQREVGAPAGVTVASADVLFGPSGSDLAFTRWPGTPQPIYAALDLRDGRWLAVQNGR